MVMGGRLRPRVHGHLYSVAARRISWPNVHFPMLPMPYGLCRQLLVKVILTLFMGMPCVVIVTVCRDPLYETDIEPEKPPPTIDRFIRPASIRPLASPDALNVRSSHVPDTFSPCCAMAPRISILL